MEIKDVKVGSKVWGRGQKKPFKVISRDDRFIVISKPQFDTFQYSIIDLENNFMGPDDLIFGGYDYLHRECNDEFSLGGADAAISDIRIGEDIESGKINSDGKPHIIISRRHGRSIIKFDKIEI